MTAIEALFEVAQVVLAEKGKHATGEESMGALLVRERMITDDQAAHLRRMYGFRNRLVHAYGTLDDEKVADYLHEHIGDIETLLATFRDLASR